MVNITNSYLQVDISCISPQWFVWYFPLFLWAGEGERGGVEMYLSVYLTQRCTKPLSVSISCRQEPFDHAYPAVPFQLKNFLNLRTFNFEFLNEINCTRIIWRRKKFPKKIHSNYRCTLLVNSLEYLILNSSTGKIVYIFH